LPMPAYGCCRSLMIVYVKRQGWGESCSIRLWERETYVLKGARTSPKGEVRESKHAVEPGANSTGPCGRPHGRQIFYSICYHADIRPDQFHAVFLRILEGRAQEYYLHFVNQRTDTFLTVYTKLKNHFDTDVNHSHYYAD
jgi:hypothetical protein